MAWASGCSSCATGWRANVMGVETVIVEGEAVDEVSAMIERVKAQALASRKKKAPRKRRKARPEKRTKRKAVQRARRGNRR